MRPLRVGIVLMALVLGGLAAAPPAGADVARAKGISCLPGTWTFAVQDTSGPTATGSNSGDGTVTLVLGPGRSLLQTYADTITNSTAGPNGTDLRIEQTYTGTIRARYAATVSKLQLKNVRNDTSMVMNVFVNGAPSTPATEQPAPGTITPKTRSLRYRCTGDTLTLASPGGLAEQYSRSG